MFEEIIRPLPQSVIDDCTIWVTPLVNTGSYYETRYAHADKLTLLEYCKRKIEAIDAYCSPRASAPYRNGDMWAINITYHAPQLQPPPKEYDAEVHKTQAAGLPDFLKTAEIIENTTVYNCYHETYDGSYARRYWHKDKATVMEAAIRASIGSVNCTIGVPELKDGVWVVVVSRYTDSPTGPFAGMNHLRATGRGA